MKEIVFGESLCGKISGAAKRGRVLLSHGAGGNMDAALIARTADELNKIGFLTMRWNFGYVGAGRAPSAGGKREIPEMKAAVEYLKSLSDDVDNVKTILIGKSFGGRLATYLGAERNDIDGYVFYGLPIIGAGKNARPRDWSHLARLGGTSLFVTGERDKLCPLEPLAEFQKYFQSPFESVVVPGDHSFKPRGEEAALRSCIDWVDSHF